MSLTIAISTQEGIILAADSRQTYKNSAGYARIGSDSATKVFSVHEKIGVTVAGPAFLPDLEIKNNAKAIGAYIREVIDQVGKADTVSIVADKLQTRLEEVYDPTKQISEGEKQIEQQIISTGGKIIKKELTLNKDALFIDFIDSKGNNAKTVVGIIPITLIVAGYDKTGLNVFTVNIPGKKQHKREQGKQNQYGADWSGQFDVISRVILGYDPRINALEFVQASNKVVGEEKVKNNLQSLQYMINWGAMTLQDAIDFAKLMIKTTTAVQRFSDGILMAPGDIPGVGGPIDVAVILPDKGFHWYQRKVLPLEKSNI